MAVKTSTSKTTGKVTSHRVVWRLNGERTGAWQSVKFGPTKGHAKQAALLDAWLRDMHGYRMADTDARVDEFLGRTPKAEPEPESLTLYAAMHAFIYETPNRKERTRVAYRATLKRLGALGDKAVADLTRRDLNRWFAACDAKGYAPKTMAVSKAVFQGTLKAHAADAAELLRDVRYDASARRNDPKDLTDEQVCDLIAHAGDAGLALLIRVAVETGMRRGELAGLTAGDVDLARGVIRVRFQLADRANDSRAYGFERETLKTPRHRRDVPISPALADALALVAELPAETPVFAQPGSGNWHHGKDWWLFAALGLRLAAVVRATPSVPNTVTMHDFRHTAGMRWLRQGASLGLVSKLLGHANVGITDSCYSHWNDADASALIRESGLRL